MSIQVSSSKPEKAFSIRFGLEEHPVLIVDEFYPNPSELVSVAQQRSQFSVNSDDFYPGIKRALYDKRYAACLKAYEPSLVKAFGLPAGSMKLDTCCYSISTTPEDQLLPIQCVPHFDTPDSHQIAAVHYLCDEDCGGTSFYRHAATRFEEITPERIMYYQNNLGRQASSHGLPPAAYIRGSTELFTKIGSIHARFNRVIFYRSSVLHSGDLLHLKSGSGMASDARLTITSNLEFDKPIAN